MIDVGRNYRPVSEQPTPQPVEIVGALPDDLRGTYARIGPNRTSAQGRGGLWFDGQGMVHAVRLDGDDRSYRNRWVATASRDLAVPSIGRAVEPASAGLSRADDGGLLALSDVGRPWRLDLPDLRTDGPDRIDGPPLSVLPHLVAVDGRAVTIGSAWTDTTLQFLERGADGVWTATGTLDVPTRPFLHDLATVGDALVVTDLPWQRGGRGPAWRPDSGAALIVADRRGAWARSFDVTPTHISHLAAAWTDLDDVVIVGCRRRSPGVATDEVNPYEASSGSLRRWTLRADGSAVEDDIDDAPCDFPVLLPDRQRVVVTRPAGDNYTVAAAISVVDLGTGERRDHHFGPGRWGGEFTPVALAGGVTVLVGYVFDGGRDASELVVLDADSLDRPLASVLLETRVPFGLHGVWVPE